MLASPPSAAAFSVRRVVNAVSIASSVVRVVNREGTETKSIPWHKIDICYSPDFLSAHFTVQSSEESTVLAVMRIYTLTHRGRRYDMVL